MSDSTVPVFFYGLFMDAQMLREKGAHPANERKASLRGYALRLANRATLVKSARGEVHGVLMDLSQADLDALYADPSVGMYRPEPVSATAEDGTSVCALAYTLPVEPPAGESNPQYAEKLRAVAERLGLPREYISTIL